MKNLHTLLTLLTLDNIMKLVGILTLLSKTLKYINKLFFKNLISFKEVVKSMKELAPTNRNTGIKINTPSLITQVAVDSVVNRYTASDIDGYIKSLETLDSKILRKFYSIDNLINKLYDFNINIRGNNTFGIQMDCYILIQIATSSRTNESLFLKLIKYLWYYIKNIFFKAKVFLFKIQTLLELYNKQL